MAAPDGLDGDCGPWGVVGDSPTLAGWRCPVCTVEHDSALAADYCCRDLPWTRR